jgi:hypothetical protein
MDLVAQQKRARQNEKALPMDRREQRIGEQARFASFTIRFISSGKGHATRPTSPSVSIAKTHAGRRLVQVRIFSAVYLKRKKP